MIVVGHLAVVDSEEEVEEGEAITIEVEDEGEDAVLVSDFKIPSTFPFKFGQN